MSNDSVSKNSSDEIQAVAEHINKKGIMVDLHVGKWAGKKAISFEEIGLPKESGDVFTRSSMKLVNKERINVFSKIEQKMRNLLYQESVKVFSSFRYIPWERYTGFNEKLNKLIDEFNTEKEKFLEFYDVALNEQTENIERIAKEVWSQSGSLRVKYPDSNTYTDFVVAKMQEFWPSKQDMEFKFHVSVDVMQIQPPGSIGSAVVSGDVMEKALLDAQKQAQDSVTEFVKRAMGELRLRTIEICTHVRSVMKSSGKITEKSLNPLREFITRFNELNFCDDKECEEYLDDLSTVYLGCDAESITEDADLWDSFGQMLDEAVEIGKNVTDEIAIKAISDIAGKSKRKIA